MMNPGKIPVGDSFVSSSLLDSQATCSNGPVSRRVVQMQEWAPAQEAFFPNPDSTTLNPIREPSTHHVTEAYKSRVRSLSMSLPGLTEHGSDDSNYGHALAKCRSHGLGSKQESKQYRAGEPSSSKHGHHGRLGRMLRRASISLRTGVREFMHRRPSVPTGSSFDNGESSAGAGLLSPPQDTYRPTSSHSPWHRLRKAASFQRHSRVLQLCPGDRHFERELEVIESPTFPIPGSGAHPPIIPRNTGAAARQAAAIACNGLPGHSWDWLESPAPRPGWLAEDELDDHESGIGIAISRADTETNLAADEADSDVDVGSTVCGDGADIVKVDFIAQLPTELAIHILSLLDAPALSTASRVSKAWNYVIRNQHIWRESFMREKTATYATSGPVKPGLGLGVPPVRPTNDWKEIYRVKEELDKHWKEGLAAPVYLTGHTDSIYCLQFDESKIITGSRDRTIRVWDIKTLACKLVIGPPEILNGSSTSLLYDDSGNPVHYAMFPDLDPTPTVDGQPRSALKACHSTPVLYSPPTHHKASILCLQYDDDILVTGSSDSTCIVYNIRSGYRPIRRLKHHSAAVLDLAFDDKHIVTCSKDVSICVWDRQTGALLKQLRGHAGPVNAVQLRGNTIVSCSGDFRVKLWNIDTGKNIREFLGHNKGLACSQFTEDGRYIASAGNDKVIRIWDANTGECVREMKAHENLVRSLHVDSVSGRLVSGSYDSDMKVWDMETGQPLLDFPKWHSSWVLSAKSDYRRMISTGQDPKILILDFGAGIKNIDMLESKSSKASAAELEQLERWHAEGGYI